MDSDGPPRASELQRGDAFVRIDFCLLAVAAGCAAIGVGPFGFVPAPSLQWLAVAAPVLALSAATAAALWRRGARGSGLPASARVWLRALCGAIVLHQLSIGAAPLALHRLAQPQPSTWDAPATVHASSRRGCPRLASFAGDSWWLRRRVCLPDEAFQAARASGRVRLHGTRSRFGFQVGAPSR